MKAMIKRVLVLTACILIMAAFAGCAGSNFDADNTPVAVCRPKLPADIKTFEAARKDLAGLLEHRYSNLHLYFFSNYLAQHGLEDLMRTDAGQIEEGVVADAKSFTFISPPYRPYFEIEVDTKTISVRDDMLKLSPRLFVCYEDLPHLPITVKKLKNGEAVFLGDRQVAIGGLNEGDAHRIAIDLCSMQPGCENFQKENEHQRALFASLAAQYRGLAVKPPMPEEQRKYIVQANALSRIKDYDGAIDLYQKAIHVDPVSYPGAYFNLALLYAQTTQFDMAISCMKQYLLLVPEAKDARSAQDKIYEWEIMMKK